MRVPNNRPFRVLAIDPGYDRLGIAVVEGDASRPVLVWSTCVVPYGEAPEKRLSSVGSAVIHAVQAYAPDILAIETLFFSINKKTAIGVAQARGVILSVAGKNDIPVIECSPQQIKLSVTGYGGANKVAVAHMIPKLLVLPNKKRLDDEFDAIAIGITALAHRARKH